MKKALELSPEQPYVLNYLGYSWIDQGMQPRRRHEDAEARRPSFGPTTARSPNSVGWAYYRLGQFDKAVEWLRAGERAEG